MFCPAKQTVLYRILLVIIGVALGIGALTARTLIDARDVEKIIEANTPKVFKTENKLANVYKEIISKPIYLKPDAYYWILYATELVKENKIRLWKNNYDNVPFGREISWNSGYLWYLAFLGKVNAHFTGRNLVSGIEHAGRWANPILVGVFGMFWGIILGIRFNPFVGGIFPFMFFFCGATLPDMTFGFGDHHVLHISLALSHLLAIIMAGAGFVQSATYRSNPQHTLIPLRPVDYKTARRWFVMAGIFGGAGLWVGASQQSLIIAMIGYGGCLAALLCNRDNENKGSDKKVILEPRLWRYWGWTGAIASCFFYLIEYYPDHFGMRLEINHPLYALAWLGGAEIVYRICRLTVKTPMYEKGVSSYLIPFFSLLAVCALPAAILAGPESWHIMHDQVTLRWHDSIYEYMSLFDFGEGRISFKYFFDRFGLYPLVLLASAFCFHRSVLNSFQRALLCQAWIPALFLFCLYVYEVRWAVLSATALIVLTIVFFSGLFQFTERFHDNKRIKKSVVFFILLFLIPHWVTLIQTNYSQRNDNNGIFNRFYTLSVMFLAREIAINFKMLTPNEEIRLVGAGSLAPMLAYYGVARSVGSPYWTNHEGIRDDNKFFSAYSESEALEVVHKRAVTHALFEMGDFEQVSKALWTYKGSSDVQDLKRTLAYRVLSRPDNNPEWLDPYPFVYSSYINKYKMVCKKIDTSSSFVAGLPGDNPAR